MWCARTAAWPAASTRSSTGFEPPPFCDQVLRNHSVGSTCSGAASGPRLHDADPDQHVIGRRLGVFDEDVEVAVVVEHAGVEQLVLGLVLAAAAVGRDEVVVRIGRLRILVQVLHVRVRRRRVEVEVVLLHVLAVVALAVGQAEGALLEDRIAAVPQRQREAQHLVVVADAAQAVLAPAVGARARLVVGEVVPGVAVVAVVLAHRAPLPLAQVGSPLLPGRAVRSRFVEPALLCFVAHNGRFLAAGAKVSQNPYESRGLTIRAVRLIVRPEGRLYFLNDQNVAEQIDALVKQHKPPAFASDMSSWRRRRNGCAEYRATGDLPRRFSDARPPSPPHGSTDSC